MDDDYQLCPGVYLIRYGGKIYAASDKGLRQIPDFIEDVMVEYYDILDIDDLRDRYIGNDLQQEGIR
jgi:hypothetical protein